MIKRLRGLGIVLAIIGIVFVVGGAYAFMKVQEGYTSLGSFSAAQNVQLAYNDEGQLLDRGTPEGAVPIMALLEDDWGYPVVASELDPNDPLVNTGTEYMYQMATVAYHTLHSTQTIVLAEDVEYNGELFAAGTYEFPVDGRYWAAFDRQHPLEGPARAQAWTGVAHALIGELGVGAVTASTLQLGLGVAGLVGGLGGTLVLTGLGLVWATRAETEKVAVRRQQPAGVTV
ncbi:MAG: hypothetical protein K5924_10410 [Chloroflexi bacterium]|nr:hypothetical protein [Chloroflexota bacterium]